MKKLLLVSTTVFAAALSGGTPTASAQAAGDMDCSSASFELAALQGNHALEWYENSILVLKGGGANVSDALGANLSASLSCDFDGANELTFALDHMQLEGDGVFDGTNELNEESGFTQLSAVYDWSATNVSFFAGLNLVNVDQTGIVIDGTDEGRFETSGVLIGPKIGARFEAPLSDFGATGFAGGMSVYGELGLSLLFGEVSINVLDNGTVTDSDKQDLTSHMIDFEIGTKFPVGEQGDLKVGLKLTQINDFADWNASSSGIGILSDLSSMNSKQMLGLNFGYEVKF